MSTFLRFVLFFVKVNKKTRKRQKITQQIREVRVMLKGCNKRVVYMKNTDSDMFEEAYFIVRAKHTPHSSERDMVAEAERIIRESATEKKRGRRRARTLFSYLMGILSATVFYTVLGIIFFYTS